MRAGVALAWMLAGFLLGGCASVPLASRQEHSVAKAMQPRPGHALIYLYREGIFGAVLLLKVALDGKHAGETAPDTYFVWEVPAGEHVLTSATSESTLEGSGSTLHLDLEAGQTAYVQQEVRM